MFRALTFVAALLCVLGSACSGNQGSGVSHDAAASLALSAAANLSPEQVATFQADVRSSWAVAYDPAVPAGCVPGGLESAIGERPCRAYILERVKMTWTLRAVGEPGSIDLPAGVPTDLGAPGRLRYFGR
jgi:hypothetical protein